MKIVTPILVLAMVAELFSIQNVYAENITHKPWFAHQTQTKFIAKPSTRHLALSRSRPAAEPSPIVATSHPSAKGERIVQQASKYQGVPYRFGGDSKYKGFDCSGLVERIYHDLNFEKLPHNSAGLYKMGKPIHLSELRPGDLVFFKNTYKHGISHVGVYAGHNQFIHARNRHYGVTITSLADPYYQLHYAGARRLY